MRLKGSGFSLIEALVAVAVVAVAIALLGYFVTALQAMRTSQTETVGINWARTYTDTTRAMWNLAIPCATPAASNSASPSNICTSYPDAQLPQTTAPEGYVFAVAVRTATTDLTPTDVVVASCPLAVSCPAPARAQDASVLAWPSRVLTVTVRDAQGKETALSTAITRTDIP